MIYADLFIILAALAYWYWSARFVPAEVAQNAADIKANGSADDLQQGYHSRRTWARIWPALACCVAPPLPLLLGEGVWSGVLGFLAMVALIGGYFARYFTPLLNLAQQLDYKPEWYASPASKSWPDALIWKQVRASTVSGPAQQAYANRLLEKLLTNTWHACLAAATLLAVAAVWVAAGRGMSL